MLPGTVRGDSTREGGREAGRERDGKAKREKGGRLQAGGQIVPCLQ